MINAIYDDMLSETYYAISSKNTLSLNVFGGKSQNEQIKDLIKSELESLTDNRFSALKRYNNSYIRMLCQVCKRGTLEMSFHHRNM